MNLYAEGTSKRYEIVTFKPDVGQFEDVAPNWVSFASEAQIAAFHHYGRFTVNGTGSRPVNFDEITIEVECQGQFCDTYYLSLSPNGLFAVTGTAHYDIECERTGCQTLYRAWSLHRYNLATETASEIFIHPFNSFEHPAISNDGNWISFITAARGLVPNDTNDSKDLFLYDLATDTFTLVSQNQAGMPANGEPTVPSMAADGQSIVFGSTASDLVAGDSNGVNDIFLFERLAGEITRLSVNAEGIEANNSSENGYIEAGGRYLVFVSKASNLVPNDTNAAPDVFRRDLQTGAIERVSLAHDGAQANGHAVAATISGNGTKIAFTSFATNLVPNDTNEMPDVFVRDLTTATTTRVSVRSNGEQVRDIVADPWISADGRLVVFTTPAPLQASDTNGFTDIYAHDWLGRTYRISETAPRASAFAGRGSIAATGISADGRMIGYSREDGIYLFDRHSQRHLLLSESSYFPTPPAISANGLFIAAIEGSMAYRHERLTGTREHISLGNDGEVGLSNQVLINGDGQLVAFTSPTDIGWGGHTPTALYTRNLATGVTTLVMDTFVAMPSLNDLSTNGRYLLVTVQEAGVEQVLLHDLSLGETEVVSLTEAGLPTNASAYGTSVSGDGRYFTFLTEATNVTADDQNSTGPDLFLRDRVANTTVLLSKDITGSNEGGRTLNGIISDNGRFILLATTLVMLAEDPNGNFDIYLLDRNAGTTTRISPEQGVGDPTMPEVALALSEDGTVVSFQAEKRYIYLDENPEGNESTAVFIYDSSTPELNHRFYAPILGR